MSIAARNAMLAGGSWKNPYVTDGLIAMWDGEWNAGGGVHDPNATEWKDLVGTHDLTIVSNAQIITDNSIKFQNTAQGGKLSSQMNNTRAIEICVKVMRTGEQAIFNPIAIAGVGVLQYVTVWYYSNALGSGYNKKGYAIGTNNAVTMYSDCARDDYVDFSAKALNGVITTPTGQTDFFNSADTRGFGFRNAFPFQGEVYSVRLYSRALTAAEVAANYAVDKARFNLT